MTQAISQVNRTQVLGALLAAALVACAFASILLFFSAPQPAADPATSASHARVAVDTGASGRRF